MTLARKLQTKGVVAVSLLVLTGISPATDDKAAGNALIEKARKASDIRAEGAPAFRMEGTFRIIPKKGGRGIDGSYTEIWVSKTKWRREAQTSSSHDLEIGAAEKKWLVDSGPERLSATFSPRLTLLPEPFSRDAPEITGVFGRQVDSVKATCVKSKSRWSKGIDCVDPDSNVLLLHESDSRGNRWPASRSCEYRNYERFGERAFPRLVRCASDQGDEVELTILKLVAEPSPEEALFTKPQGASEIGNCQGGVAKPPQAEYSPDPGYPDHHNENTTVVLWTIVGEDGKPRDSRVARSVGKDFDQSALDALQHWKFKPATCDGLPIAAVINIEMSVRKF
ncbi:MAG: energy transducer TonB [Acidobacteriia bacterium]|nr:energy transducer TonB [Terriglobia bacterium]